MTFADIAGLPVEETLPALAPGLGAALLMARGWWHARRGLSRGGRAPRR